MHVSHSTHSHVRLCRYLSYEGPVELTRGEALTGRAAAFVRGLNWVVVAGALVPPALFGLRACVSTVPADCGRCWSSTAADDGCT